MGGRSCEQYIKHCVDPFKDFAVEFYEIVNGKYPVQVFPDELKSSDQDDFPAVVAGLAVSSGTT